MKEKIHIYHTNDIHSHLENWPRIQSFLQKRKQMHEQEGELVFVFDIGDFTDRWHPFTEGSMGKGNTELLNELPYTAVTIGNNEGITMPYEGLDQLYSKANFDVIIANLYSGSKLRPSWAIPYKIYKTKHGHSIGVTAVTAYFQKLYELLGWELTEPFSELQKQLDEIKAQADFIILLSHLGIYEDEKIVQQFPQIDLIIGAHTHHYFPEGKLYDNTMMAAAGKHGKYVGYIEIDLNTKHHFSIQPVLFETEKLPTIPNEEKIIEEYKEVGKELLNIDVVHKIDHQKNHMLDTQILADLLCEAIEDWCNAECSILNSGLLIGKLNRGRITKYDLHRLLPHPINPCTVMLTGEELQEVIFLSEDKKWLNHPVIGLGFRGTVMGSFVTHNIQWNSTEQQFYVDNQPLDLTKKYKVATTDMFTFGSYFPSIQNAKKKKYFMPEFLRDVMEWKLKQINSPTSI